MLHSLSQTYTVLSFTISFYFFHKGRHTLSLYLFLPSLSLAYTTTLLLFFLSLYLYLIHTLKHIQYLLPLSLSLFLFIFLCFKQTYTNSLSFFLYLSHYLLFHSHSFTISYFTLIHSLSLSSLSHILSILLFKRSILPLASLSLSETSIYVNQMTTLITITQQHVLVGG